MKSKPKTKLATAQGRHHYPAVHEVDKTGFENSGKEGKNIRKKPTLKKKSTHPPKKKPSK